MTRQKHRPQVRLLIGRTSPGLTLIDNTDLPLLPVVVVGGGGACHERRARCKSSNREAAPQRGSDMAHVMVRAAIHMVNGHHGEVSKRDGRVAQPSSRSSRRQRLPTTTGTLRNACCLWPATNESTTAISLAITRTCIAHRRDAASASHIGMTQRETDHTPARGV
jgi:hypothetical protein